MLVFCNADGFCMHIVVLVVNSLVAIGNANIRKKN